MATRTRGPNGAYRRSLKTAARDPRAADLFRQGWSYQRIADELRFASRGHAHDPVHPAFAHPPPGGAHPGPSLHLDRTDRLIEQAWAVMLRPHVAHSGGSIVRRQAGWERDSSGEIVFDGEGAPIPVYEELADDGPVLAAIDRIRALLERRAKTIGYDAPARSRIEVITAEMVEAEIARLEAEHGDDPGTP